MGLFTEFREALQKYKTQSQGYVTSTLSLFSQKDPALDYIEYLLQPAPDSESEDYDDPTVFIVDETTPYGKEIIEKRLSQIETLLYFLEQTEFQIQTGGWVWQTQQTRLTLKDILGQRQLPTLTDGHIDSLHQAKEKYADRYAGKPFAISSTWGTDYVFYTLDGVLTSAYQALYKQYQRLKNQILTYYPSELSHLHHSKQYFEYEQGYRKDLNTLEKDLATFQKNLPADSKDIANKMEPLLSYDGITDLGRMGVLESDDKIKAKTPRTIKYEKLLAFTGESNAVQKSYAHFIACAGGQSIFPLLIAEFNRTTLIHQLPLAEEDRNKGYFIVSLNASDQDVIWKRKEITEENNQVTQIYADIKFPIQVLHVGNNEESVKYSFVLNRNSGRIESLQEIMARCETEKKEQSVEITNATHGTDGTYPPLVIIYARMALTLSSDGTIIPHITHFQEVFNTPLLTSSIHQERRIKDYSIAEINASDFTKKLKGPLSQSMNPTTLKESLPAACQLELSEDLKINDQPARCGLTRLKLATDETDEGWIFHFALDVYTAAVEETTQSNNDPDNNANPETGEYFFDSASSRVTRLNPQNKFHRMHQEAIQKAIQNTLEESHECAPIITLEGSITLTYTQKNEPIIDVISLKKIIHAKNMSAPNLIAAPIVSKEYDYSPDDINASSAVDALKQLSASETLETIKNEHVGRLAENEIKNTLLIKGLSAEQNAISLDVQWKTEKDNSMIANIKCNVYTASMNEPEEHTNYVPTDMYFLDPKSHELQIINEKNQSILKDITSAIVDQNNPVKNVTPLLTVEATVKMMPNKDKNNNRAASIEVLSLKQIAHAREITVLKEAEHKPKYTITPTL